MRDDLRHDIIARLKAEYGFRQARAGYLRRGKCPSCQENELWVSEKEPWLVRCGRENKCGWTASVKELYPDAFGKINERYPASTQDPNATADAYMGFVRGISVAAVAAVAAEGAGRWWRQGRFWHPKGNRTTASVVFDLFPPGQTEPSNLWMERLVEPVEIKGDDGDVDIRKANFVGVHKGLWWQPPGLDIASGDDLWIVEGCIDAISLALHGIKAVASLSASNYPDKMLAALAEKGSRPTLVWALDGDKAGTTAIRKHVEAARNDGWTCKAAVIWSEGKKKTDWNDAHQAGRLEKKDLALYRHHGDLLLAASAREKALLMWQWQEASFFSFEFANRTYWFELDNVSFSAKQNELKKDEDKADLTDKEIRELAAEQVAQVSEVCNAAFQFLYFQRSELTDESWYYARVRFPHGRYVVKNTFTGAQIAASSEFKKRLLSIAPGALFSGGTGQLNWIVKKHLDAIKIVETVDFIGYSQEHKAWIFPDRAVSGGKVYPINDEDFFEIGKLSIKSLNASLHLHIGERKKYQPEWLDLVYRSFGAKGVVAAAFFLGSLFAEQIRAAHKSFPFLEIVGEANAGKTTLIEALWKTVGRENYEGFDPNKASPAGRSRIMTQVANLPVSFIESDREGKDAKQRQFDWDELKTAYNGRASRVTGVKNGGNDTKEPLFRGSILISQNAPVNASEAIMQRIIHLYFDTSRHTSEGKRAADELACMPVEAMSHFLVMATTREAQVLKTLAERVPVHEAELLKRPSIKTVRIAKNHAQLMALVEALAELANLPRVVMDEALAVLSDAAESRQQAIASDHQIVEEFWDAVDFLGLGNLNHAQPNSGIIAINLNHFIGLATRAGQQIPALIDLKRHLKSSRSRPFIDSRVVRSALGGDFNDSTLRCWVFKSGGK